MKQNEILKWVKIFKYSDTKWIADIWKLIEKNNNKIFFDINKFGITVGQSKEEIELDIYKKLIKIITLAGWRDTPYLIINPPESEIYIKNKYRDKRTVRLNKSNVDELIKDLISSIYYIIKDKKFQLRQNQLEKAEIQVRKFLGKTRKEKDVKMYEAIIDLRNKLIKEYGHRHLSSRKNAVRHYSKVNRLGWNVKEINSVCESVRIFESNKK